MWVVNAIYGAALKHSELRSGQADPEFAYQRLKEIQARVQVMDKSGRASVTTFENGIGEVLLTYENEVLLRQMQGKAMPFIIPDATILIENPIAVVDKNVEFSATFPTPAHLFTIADLGGWSNVHEKLYARDGIWTRIVNELVHE